MPEWTKEQGREALATVSTLKRVLGIPNHPDKKDTFLNHDLHIYTADKDAAILLGELLYRYGNGPREKFYNARPEILTLRDTVRVEPLAEGGFDTSMNINYAPHLKQMLEKMIQKHIAPDKGFTR
jgi:hypothetical protein